MLRFATPSALLLGTALSTPLLAQDCNNNGVDDAIDLVTGTSFDCNKNGIPDECDACAGDITLITFEGFPELTPIGDQYAAEGVTFSLIGSEDLPIICTEGAPNVAFSGAGADAPLAGANGLCDADGGPAIPIAIDFDPPVTFASLFVIDIDSNDAVELRAFNGNTLVQTQGASTGEEGTGNGVGTFFQFNVGEITRIEVEFVSDGLGWAIDDVSFRRPSATSNCTSLVRVAQESAPGLGDFDSNILGFIEVFPTTTPVESLYSYDFPFNDSFNGTLFPLDTNDTNLALIQTGDNGLSLFVIHDKAEDNSGGRAEMRIEINGDPDGSEIVLRDDPNDNSDTYTGDAGDSVFTGRWNWDNCCTDGFVLGDIEGSWEIVASFSDVNGSSSTPVFSGMFNWVMQSADGNNIEMVLEEDRRIRLDQIPGPCPLSLTPNVLDVSLSAGGAQVMSLDAGPAYAGQIYFLLGTITGTQPGVNLGEVTLPLNPGPYFQLTLGSPGGSFLTGQVGFLNAAGQGTAALSLPAGSSASLAGLTAHHAFTLLAEPFVSNPCPVRLVP
jgi:hypothetical protein